MDGDRVERRVPTGDDIAGREALRIVEANCIMGIAGRRFRLELDLGVGQQEVDRPLGAARGAVRHRLDGYPAWRGAKSQLIRRKCRTSQRHTGQQGPFVPHYSPPRARAPGRIRAFLDADSATP